MNYWKLQMTEVSGICICKVHKAVTVNVEQYMSIYTYSSYFAPLVCSVGAKFD